MLIVILLDFNKELLGNGVWNLKCNSIYVNTILMAALKNFNYAPIFQSLTCIYNNNQCNYVTISIRLIFKYIYIESYSITDSHDYNKIHACILCRWIQAKLVMK